MPAVTIPPTPDTTPSRAPRTTASDPAGPRRWPYRPGDRAQMLYMSERETVLADAVVRAVSPGPDGGWVVTAILSEPRTAFALTPHVTHAARIPADPRVSIGIDHSRRSA